MMNCKVVWGMWQYNILHSDTSKHFFNNNIYYKSYQCKIVLDTLLVLILSLYTLNPKLSQVAKV